MTKAEMLIACRKLQSIMAEVEELIRCDEVDAARNELLMNYSSGLCDLNDALVKAREPNCKHEEERYEAKWDGTEVHKVCSRCMRRTKVL